MITSHFAFALAAKRARPAAPVWLLLVAALAPDLAEATLEMSGASSRGRAMWSHSILAALSIAVALALPVWQIARDAGTAAIVSAMVPLHVAADYVTGRKPTWPGGPLVGLGLYRVPLAEFAVEAVLVFACWLVWRGSLAPQARTSWPARGMLLMLLGVQGAADAAIHVFGRALP